MFNFWIVVGNSDLPAETTCRASTEIAAYEVVVMFAPGGSMWRPGDVVKTVVYAPGTRVPESVAIHV